MAATPGLMSNSTRTPRDVTVVRAATDACNHPACRCSTAMRNASSVRLSESLQKRDFRCSRCHTVGARVAMVAASVAPSYSGLPTNRTPCTR